MAICSLHKHADSWGKLHFVAGLQSYGLEEGVNKFRATDGCGVWILYGGAYYLRIPSIELATCHLSGAWYFELAPRFLEKFVHSWFRARVWMWWYLICVTGSLCTMNYTQKSLCNVISFVFSKMRAKTYEEKFVVFVRNFISYTNTNKIRTAKLYEEIITSREKLGE
jgi:hypothetical protein